MSVSTERPLKRYSGYARMLRCKGESRHSRTNVLMVRSRLKNAKSMRR